MKRKRGCKKCYRNPCACASIAEELAQHVRGCSWRARLKNQKFNRRGSLFKCSHGYVGACFICDPCTCDNPIEWGDLDERRIFVRPNGDDKNGDGSEEKPYKSFTKAMSQIPSFIPEGIRFSVDTLSDPLDDDYSLPVIRTK